MEALITQLLPRDEIDRVSHQEWDELSSKSIFKNPFYARNCLTAAFKSLDSNKTLFLAVSFADNKLVTLFPVEFARHKIGFKMINVWSHNHCPLSDPLSLNNTDTSRTIFNLLQQTGATCFGAERHSPQSLGELVTQKSLIHQTFRGQVSQFKAKKEYYACLPAKVRSESKRIVRRINQELNLSYKTSKELPEFGWFEAYCQLEHSGWKSGAKGSILSQPNYLQYYNEFIDKALNNNQVEFQGIFHDEKPVALSFRMISENCAFDIKTSYDEAYRRLYPGVVLEILNLIELHQLDFDFVDSCTQPNNRVINRLWPEQKIVHDSIFFKNSFIGTVLDKMMRWKRSNTI